MKIILKCESSVFAWFISIRMKRRQKNVFSMKTNFALRSSDGAMLRNVWNIEMVQIWENRLDNWLKAFLGMPVFNFSLLRTFTSLKWTWLWIPPFRHSEFQCGHIQCLTYLRFFFSVKQREWNLIILKGLYTSKNVWFSLSL